MFVTRIVRCALVPLWAWLILAILPSLASAQTQVYSPQPSTDHSIIYGIGIEPITDVEFAKMAAPLFLKNGNQSNTYGASFFFQECYAGGMFGELESALGPNVSWVGGSASAHNQVAYAYGGDSLYTAGLYETLNIHDSMIGLANFARIFDEAGPNGSDPMLANSETPQSLFRGPEGNSIDFRDSFIQEHTAILFAGHADAARHYKGIKQIYQRLVEIYEDSNRPYTILVLGDAAYLPGIPVFGPASQNSLADAFDALAPLMDTRTDFFFYGTDHGGVDKPIVNEPTPPQDPGPGYIDYFAPDFSLIKAILDSSGTPQIVLRFDKLISPGVHLLLNGFDLGDALRHMGRHGESTFDLTKEMLEGFGPTVEFRLKNESEDSFILNSAFFRSGEIDTPDLQLLAEVPSPVAAVVLLPAVAAFRLRRRAA